MIYFMFLFPLDYMLLQGMREAPGPHTVPGTFSAQYKFIEMNSASFLRNSLL